MALQPKVVFLFPRWVHAGAPFTRAGHLSFKGAGARVLDTFLLRELEHACWTPFF